MKLARCDQRDGNRSDPRLPQTTECRALFTASIAIDRMSDTEPGSPIFT